MPATITTILDQEIPSATPTSTLWFSNCQFLVFHSNVTGEYVATGEFIEVAASLFVEIVPGPIGAIERVVKEWDGIIDTIHLIKLPPQVPNNCFPMRLQINPSTGFHARILAISC